MAYSLYLSHFEYNFIFTKFTNLAYLINVTSVLHLMINLKMLCLLPLYNQLINCKSR